VSSKRQQPQRSLQIGLEDMDELKADLEQGFERLK
jgi:cystathionine beta-lyase/cystathionine gamma-synthase